MAEEQLQPVTDFLEQFTRTQALSTGSDEQLLEQFILKKDGEAFAALVHRHGPMVLAVCRRVLQNHHAAEDAFQATFLVLARKSCSISQRELLSNWLYGVAYRTALKARSTWSQWESTEEIGLEPVDAQEPLCEVAWRELKSILDREIQNLPPKYREPVILCYLEGRTYNDAARELGWPAGTVSGRLAKARELLRERLARQGLTLSAGALITTLASAPLMAQVPLKLSETTIKAARLLISGGTLTGMASNSAILLMEGVVKGMFISKIKSSLIVVLILGLLGIGAHTATGNGTGGPPGTPGAVPPGTGGGTTPPGGEGGFGEGSGAFGSTPKLTRESVRKKLADLEKQKQDADRQLEKLEAQQRRIAREIEQLRKQRLNQEKDAIFRDIERALQKLWMLTASKSTDIQALRNFEMAYGKLKEQLSRKALTPGAGSGIGGLPSGGFGGTTGLPPGAGSMTPPGLGGMAGGGSGIPGMGMEGTITTTEPGTVRGTERSGLVNINIPSGTTLKKGMKLHVFRIRPKPTYIGELSILQVKPPMAVGRMTSVKAQQAVRRGDLITVHKPGSLPRARR